MHRLVPMVAGIAMFTAFQSPMALAQLAPPSSDESFKVGSRESDWAALRR